MRTWPTDHYDRWHRRVCGRARGAHQRGGSCARLVDQRFRISHDELHKGALEPLPQSGGRFLHRARTRAKGAAVQRPAPAAGQAMRPAVRVATPAEDRWAQAAGQRRFDRRNDRQRRRHDERRRRQHRSSRQRQRLLQGRRPRERSAGRHLQPDGGWVGDAPGLHVRRAQRRSRQGGRHHLQLRLRRGHDPDHRHDEPLHQQEHRHRRRRQSHARRRPPSADLQLPQRQFSGVGDARDPPAPRARQRQDHPHRHDPSGAGGRAGLLAGVRRRRGGRALHA
jgi:hypothetical protein